MFEVAGLSTHFTLVSFEPFQCKRESGLDGRKLKALLECIGCA